MKTRFFIDVRDGRSISNTTRKFLMWYPQEKRKKHYAPRPGYRFKAHKQNKKMAGWTRQETPGGSWSAVSAG
ncbi:hypothetical protein DPMN_131515 [Dreissena polymorpha]|uniref:Uncharacterized protein n=1 Tax=Dreissena polymorpha TaxID=45954 RepID=A0A9D4K050_DREPO|nr:hypothetical protein DPMN_131515 [Dreissena polymorpha]